MKTYLRIYRWAMQMKLHMAMYTFVAIFLKILCNLLQGADSISIRDLLTMWLVALVFAMAESAIFPEQAACTRTRTLLWLGAAAVQRYLLRRRNLSGWLKWVGILLICGMLVFYAVSMYRYFPDREPYIYHSDNLLQKIVIYRQLW